MSDANNDRELSLAEAEGVTIALEKELLAAAKKALSAEVPADMIICACLKLAARVGAEALAPDDVDAYSVKVGAAFATLVHEAQAAIPPGFEGVQ
jgi:hypothetical protein